MQLLDLLFVADGACFLAVVEVVGEGGVEVGVERVNPNPVFGGPDKPAEFAFDPLIN